MRRLAHNVAGLALTVTAIYFAAVGLTLLVVLGSAAEWRDTP